MTFTPTDGGHGSLNEKGGKPQRVPTHHNAGNYVDGYLDAAGIAVQRKTRLFRSIDTHRRLANRPMEGTHNLRMIKRGAKVIGLLEKTCYRTFRATGITTSLEHAQRIANHDSPKTPKL